MAMFTDINPWKRRRLPVLAPAPGSSQPEQLHRADVEIKHKRHQAAKACNASKTDLGASGAKQEVKIAFTLPKTLLISENP
ncbi:hypothetical protein TWF281_010299 [Arthrobotrys megalospora]